MGMSHGFGSRGRGLKDEPIALPLDEHAPTPSLGDDVEESCIDATDQVGSSRHPRGSNIPQASSMLVSSEALFHPFTRR